jgi:ABC-2 type transport system ATP-binding protein
VVAQPRPVSGLPAEVSPARNPDIEVSGLVKRYGALTAVDGVSFHVERGEVFGMLGPNGAGKTTTLEIVEGLREPDAGSVRVLGTDVLSDPGAVKQRIGVQLQATALPTFTKVREALQLFASLYRRARSPEDLIAEFDPPATTGAGSSSSSR